MDRLAGQSNPSRTEIETQQSIEERRLPNFDWTVPLVRCRKISRLEHTESNEWLEDAVAKHVSAIPWFIGHGPRRRRIFHVVEPRNVSEVRRCRPVLRFRAEPPERERDGLLEAGVFAAMDAAEIDLSKERAEQQRQQRAAAR